MKSTQAIIATIEEVLECEVVHKTDAAGTGYYDVTQRPDGFGIDRFLGEDPRLILHRFGADLDYLEE